MNKAICWVFAVAVCAVCGFPTQAIAQNSSVAPPPITFSSIGFVPGLQLTGTAKWHYGSDVQSGTVTLEGFANGQSKTTLHLNGGTRIDTQNAYTDADRTCTWVGFDGIAHDVATHNCWVPTVWFLPQITVQAGAGAKDVLISYVPASDDKTAIIHVERHPAAVRDTQTAKLLADLSAADIGVDTSTSLPQWLRFNIHPDGDAGTNLHVEVDFSDYRTVNGLTVPFHIQKLINESMVLDLQISEVQVQ
jgi:hypothetical protein